MKQFPNKLTLTLEKASENGYVYTVWENAEEAQKSAGDNFNGVITPLTITEESKGRQATPEIGTEDEPEVFHVADYDSAVGTVTLFYDGRSFHAFPLDAYPVWECDMDTL